MLTKIISGGQTGVDIAALRSAKSVGLETGGTMPKGFRTLAGPKPQYRELYGMEDHKSSEWAPRTRVNIANSDFTILIGIDLNSKGSRLAKDTAFDLRKHCASVQWPLDGNMPCSPVHEQIASFIVARKAACINIAGNRDTALEKPVEEWLAFVFRRVLQLQESK